ncbi:MAG: hypothetical protein OXF42_06220 [Candidatus Dadabacteria bacterium]|nr:hypothetical protein [Candidatus Dadabacteria bacterium]
MAKAIDDPFFDPFADFAVSGRGSIEGLKEWLRKPETNAHYIGIRLCQAVTVGNAEAIKVLLEDGRFDVNASQDKDGNTFLMYVVGVDVNPNGNNDGDFDRHAEAIGALVENGARVEVKNNLGQMALEIWREKQRENHPHFSQISSLLNPKRLDSVSTPQ